MPEPQFRRMFYRVATPTKVKRSPPEPSRSSKKATNDRRKRNASRGSILTHCECGVYLDRRVRRGAAPGRLWECPLRKRTLCACVLWRRRLDRPCGGTIPARREQGSTPFWRGTREALLPREAKTEANCRDPYFWGRDAGARSATSFALPARLAALWVLADVR